MEVPKSVLVFLVGTLAAMKQELPPSLIAEVGLRVSEEMNRTWKETDK